MSAAAAASASPCPPEGAGTPVFGAPEGTAVTWPLPGTLGTALGTRPSAVCEGCALGTEVGAAAVRLSVVGGTLGALGLALLSANADSALPPASTAVQARAVNKLRVRMKALSSIDPWRICCSESGGETTQGGGRL
jgi:hypothetical protein